MSTQEELTRRLQEAIAAQQAIGDARATAAIAADNAVEAQEGAETARDTTEGYLQDAQAAKTAAEAAVTEAASARSGAETAAGQASSSASTAQGYATAAANSIAACETAQAAAEKAAEDAHSLLDNTLQADHENTFTAAQAFHAPVTVGTPRVPAVWAKAGIDISVANMRKAGTISDNAGRTLELPEDSTRTQGGFAQAISNSELGLVATRSGNYYTLYDSSSPAGQEGTIGNTRKLYVTGFGYSSQQTLSLSGGKDGVAEVGQPVMLNGNVYIGHGPDGVKAKCYFSITAAYLTKAGTITDDNPYHAGASIALPENPSRTIDSCIAEINAQGDKLEVKAGKANATTITLESTVEGSAPNGVRFTRTGCFSTAADGTAQSTTQGTSVQGLDEGAASEWELRQNGYPVASRQTNNVYEGVQVFNNAVALNGAITGAGLDDYTATQRKLLEREAEAVAGFVTMGNDVAEYDSGNTYPAKVVTGRDGTEIVYARYGADGFGSGDAWTKLPIRNAFLTKTVPAVTWHHKDAYIIVAPTINTRTLRSSVQEGDLHVTFLYAGDEGYYHLGEIGNTGKGLHIYYSAPNMTGTRENAYMFNINMNMPTVHISAPNLVNARSFFSGVDGAAFNFTLEDGTLSKCKNAPKLFPFAKKWTAAQVLPALAALSDWSNDPDLPEEGYPLSLPAAAAFYEAVHQWWDSHGVAHTYTAGEAPVPEEPLPLGWNVTYF